MAKYILTPFKVENDLLVIYNHFCEEMNHSCERDIYSDTLRDVLFKHGYEPEWED